MAPEPVEFSVFSALLQEQTRRVSLRRCRTEKLDHRQRGLLCAHRERPEAISGVAPRCGLGP
jgi:hypothetical protein